MPNLLARLCLVALAACGSASDGPLAADGGLTDGEGAPDVPRDVLTDAAPDAPAVDTTPPTVSAIVPAAMTDAWLHEPVRFVFDEPIALDDATVTATLAGAPVAAMLSREGDRTIAVTLAANARGTGTLAIELAGTITDLAGNAANVPIVAEHVVRAWSRPATDRGAAAASPALAVGASGGVVAAWTIGATGARRVVVSRHAGAWEALGGTLGGGDTSSPAIALDALERPVVAWMEGGTAKVARWSGTAWTDLPSPGAGTHVLLASPPAGGAPVVAVLGSAASVHALSATDTWQPLGATVSTGGVAGVPALAVPAASRAVLAWIAGTGLRAARFDGATWSAIPAIALGTAPAGGARVSLAARGATIAVAWDQWSGSAGVYAATSTGGAWTRLGRALDVDVAGDASAPAIALDAGGDPIVAWRERIETAERGVIARWTGTAWTIVGGPTWLAGGSAPTPPTLALHAGAAPVVGWSAGGAIHVARFNGPRTAGAGMTRASIAGCSYDPANPPATVSATGCFTIPQPGKPVPHAGLVPYDLRTELWSDGTRKRRWIGLPNGASLGTAGNGSLTAPTGTLIVKEFAIETTPGDPATRRTIETRFLVMTASGLRGFTYRWRANGSDGDLLTDGQVTADWALDSGGSYRHVYPSRSQCLSCHHGSNGPLLGLRAPQLARWFDYDGTIADQLATLAAIDVSPVATATPYVAAHDAAASTEQRVRAYMAANCAHCHNPNNIAIKDLRYTTPLGQTRLCEVIEPGSPSTSVVYARVTSRPGMPPLGTLITDPLAEPLFASWISGMTSCP